MMNYSNYKTFPLEGKCSSPRGSFESYLPTITLIKCMPKVSRFHKDRSPVRTMCKHVNSRFVEGIIDCSTRHDNKSFFYFSPTCVM